MATILRRRHAFRWTAARRVCAMLAALLVSLAILIAQPAAAAATNLYVTHGGNDANACTQAAPCATVQRAADLSAAGTTIHVGAGTFITHLSLTVAGVTIVGSGQGQTFLDGDGQPRVITAQAQTDPSTPLTISDLTVQHGDGTGTLRDTGGILLLATELHLRRVTVTANVGNGIFNDSGHVTITGGTVSDNTGVGLDNFEGSGDASNSTFTGNGGVGIRDEACCGSTFTNVTIAQNTGGGFGAGNTSRATILDSTIANNGGSGISQAAFMMTSPPLWGTTVGGSIVANNAGVNCAVETPYATFTDAGYNLESDSGGSCGFSTGKHDLVGVDPELGPLQDNGGAADTMLPVWGSPVIDRLPNPSTLAGHRVCPGADARGIARPQGRLCDMGAVEVLTPLPPGKPTGVVATPLTRSVRLAFNPPADGGSPITSYTGLCMSANGGAIGLGSSAAPPLTVAGLTPAKSYSCAVSASNAVGTGAYSQPSNTVVIPSLPTAARAVVASPANGGATLKWTAPASDSGSPVTGYVVTPFIGTTAQTKRVLNSSATTAAIGGLTNGTIYTFKVAAKNAFGTGPNSTASPAVTVGAPVAPSAVNATRTAAGQLRVSFTPGASNGSAITGYTATCASSNGGVTKSATGVASPVTVGSLSVGKNYTCTVKAKNARGTGPASAASNGVAA